MRMLLQLTGKCVKLALGVIVLLNNCNFCLAKQFSFDTELGKDNSVALSRNVALQLFHLYTHNIPLNHLSRTDQ